MYADTLDGTPRRRGRLSGSLSFPNPRLSSWQGFRLRPRRGALRKRGYSRGPHEVFPGKDTPNEAYEPFFDNALAAAETGWFDALAHLDLCKRYGVLYFGEFDPTPFWERINRVLKTIIGNSMSLEINTSGLRQNPRACYPGEEILQRYCELGGKKITVGSDAHTSEDVGAGIRIRTGDGKQPGF